MTGAIASRITAYAPSPHVNWTDTGGGLVVYDQQRGSYHELNAVGSAIWRALEGGRTREAVIERLAGLFDADPAAISADVDPFLSSLLADGLIRPVT